MSELASPLGGRPSRVQRTLASLPARYLHAAWSRMEQLLQGLLQTVRRSG